MQSKDYDHSRSVEDNHAQREFLETRATKPPANIDELAEATEDAFAKVEIALGGRSERAPSQALEAWLIATDDLEEVFFETADGALGARMLELLALDDTTFAERRQEAEDILRNSQHAALNIYRVIHRLNALTFAPNRQEVVEQLSSGELTQQIKINNVDVNPRRLSLIGSLRALDARVGTNTWSLEVEPELPANVIIIDPFDVTNGDLRDFWDKKILFARGANKTRNHDVYTVSEDTTRKVAWDLEELATQSKNNALRTAAMTLLNWLNRKAIYYQNPQPADFENYHVGLEDTEDFENILLSIDAIKHEDPELFLELLGVNPEDGRRSHYFGSFLHKALFNTQRKIDRATPGIADMPILGMMRQLTTMSDSVSTYAGVVSQASLKAMTEHIKEQQIGSEGTTNKGADLLAMAIPYAALTISSAYRNQNNVRRQLEAMRESNIDTVSAELQRHIDDIEHPLKLMEYIAGMSQIALADHGIRNRIRPIFWDSIYGHAAVPDWQEIQDMCRKRSSEVVKSLYARIPLIDEARDDLGWGQRVKTVVRDAQALQGFLSGVADVIAPTKLTDRSYKEAESLLSPVLKDRAFSKKIP